MKKFITLLVAAFALLLAPTAVSAAGSDSPVPYSMDVEGLTLPGTSTHPANGHVNIKYLSGGVEKSAGIHMDPNNNQPGGHWIGRSFIPWTAFAADIECITWVQVSGYNEHFGEGGQEPLCLTKPPVAPPTDTEQRERITAVNCEERVVEWVKEKRDAIFEYDWTVPGWTNVGWTPWTVTETGFRNEKDASCDTLPTVGSPATMAALLAGLIALAGGGLMIRRARS